MNLRKKQTPNKMKETKLHPENNPFERLKLKDKASEEICNGITKRLLEKYKPSLNIKIVNGGKYNNRDRRAA